MCCWLSAQRLIAGLHASPEFVIDDLKVWDRLPAPLVDRVQNRGAAACVRMLAVSAAVEHADAGVEFLVQYAVRPVGAERHVLESLGELGCHLVFVLDRWGFTPPAETTDTGALF